MFSRELDDATELDDLFSRELDDATELDDLFSRELDDATELDEIDSGEFDGDDGEEDSSPHESRKKRKIIQVHLCRLNISTPYCGITDKDNNSHLGQIIYIF